VYVTSTSSNTLTVPIGSYITATVGAGAQSSLTAQADLVIYDGATKIYDISNQGYPTAGNSHTYTPTDNGTIDATAYEF
jgi:hypothetical protein